MVALLGETKTVVSGGALHKITKPGAAKRFEADIWSGGALAIGFGCKARALLSWEPCDTTG